MAKRANKGGKRKISKRKTVTRKTVKKKAASKKRAMRTPAVSVAKAARKPRSVGIRKSPVAAVLLELLLGLFIGVLGIGHFYTGRIGRGVFFLLGYWVLIFIEFIILIYVAAATFGAGLIIALPIIIVVNIAVVIASTILAYKEAKES